MPAGQTGARALLPLPRLLLLLLLRPLMLLLTLGVGPTHQLPALQKSCWLH
jgi:hypothetical protein